MTGEEWIFWGAGILLLLISSGALVGCEFALVKLRYDPLETNDLEELRAHPWIRRMIDRSALTARILRFSKTGCTIILGTLLVVFSWSIQLHWFPAGNFPALPLVAVIFGFALPLHYLLVELLPRGWALRNPGGMLRVTLPVVTFFEMISWPFLAVLWAVKARIYTLIGLKVEEDLNPLDVEVQIRALGEDTPILSKVVRSIINRTLQMRNLTVADILLPRNQVVIFDMEDTLEENLELAKKNGHTRYPLCEGDLDHCIGIIHIKDLFRYRRDLATLDLKRMARPIVRFHENDPLERVFQSMLSYKVHMSLVQDEFGGVLGVVTLERILEVLVGEIQDEFDFEENLIARLGAGRYRVSGLTPIHDLEKELGIDIGPSEVATFGGLVTQHLGHIPQARDKVTIGPLEIQIIEVDETRIISTLVTLVEPVEEAKGGD